MRVIDVRSKNLGLTQERHRLEVDKRSLPPQTKIFSPEIDAQLLNAEEVLLAATNVFPVSRMVPSETLVEWAKSLNQSFPPGRFRGLFSLFVPSQPTA